MRSDGDKLPTKKKIMSTCTSCHLERVFLPPEQTQSLRGTASRSGSVNGLYFSLYLGHLSASVIRVQVNMMMRMMMMMAPVRTHRVTVVSSPGEKKGAFGSHTHTPCLMSKYIYNYGFTFLLAGAM